MNEKMTEKISKKDSCNLWRITFDTNPDDCNLNCIMCEANSKFNHNKSAKNQSRRVMDINLVRKILLDMQGSNLQEIIPSTMGEPLLYKNFSEIISMCHEFNVKLNLTTNGTFPGKSVTEWAKLIVPITSDVKISFNGATKITQENIMSGSKYDTHINNIKEFIAYRDYWSKQGGNYCRVTLQLTFLRNNVDELVDIIKMAIDLGVNRVKGHHVWTHYPELEELSMRKDAATINHWNKVVKSVQEVAGTKILLENFTLLDEGATKDLNPKAVCPFLGKEAWVAHDGNFSPCCAPAELRKKLGSFGNLNKKSLYDIFVSNEYKNLCNNYMQNKLCVNCNMRR